MTRCAFYLIAVQARSWRIGPYAFHLDDIPEDTDAWLAFCTDLGANIRIREPDAESSRTLRNLAGEAFVELYPNGRKGTPWKDVARLVADKIDRQVSVKTLMRAVKERTT